MWKQIQPLDVWLRQFLMRKHRVYNPRFVGLPLKRRLVCEPTTTRVGPAVVADASTRLLVQLFRWRGRRRQRSWLVHDESHNQLVLVQLACRGDDYDATLEAVLAGLHWLPRSE